MNNSKQLSKTILFTPGPVPMSEEILSVSQIQPPYGRSVEAVHLLNRLQAKLQYLIQAAQTTQILTLTSSGTGAMEAALTNFIRPEDRLMMIAGGEFGMRWCHMAQAHRIPFEMYTVERGKKIDLEALEVALKKHQINTLCIAAHETSTGQLFDLKSIGQLCQKWGVFLMVDAISSIGADQFQMAEWGIDVTLFCSQKALALQPGLAFIAVSERALNHFSEYRGFYFDLQKYLKGIENGGGQLPFTGAMSVLLQLEVQLSHIEQMGLPAWLAAAHQKAQNFRERVHQMQGSPFRVFPEVSGNAVTALWVEKGHAKRRTDFLRDQCGIELAYNRGDIAEHLFRVCHMGVQTEDDLDALFAGFAAFEAFEATSA